MDNDDYEYARTSVVESLALMFWVSFFTLTSVGAILGLAL